jgi:hypothetical protein
VTNGSTLYQVSLKSGGSYVFSQIEKADFLEIACFKGLAYGSPRHRWLMGKTIYIPVSDISVIYEYPSPAEYASAIKISSSAQRRDFIRKWAFWISLAIGWMLLIFLLSHFSK